MRRWSTVGYGGGGLLTRCAGRAASMAAEAGRLTGRLPAATLVISHHSAKVRVTPTGLIFNILTSAFRLFTKTLFTFMPKRNNISLSKFQTTSLRSSKRVVEIGVVVDSSSEMGQHIFHRKHFTIISSNVYELTTT